MYILYFASIGSAYFTSVSDLFISDDFSVKSHRTNSLNSDMKGDDTKQ